MEYPGEPLEVILAVVGPRLVVDPTEAEGNLRLSGREDFVERRPDLRAAVRPAVRVAERVDPVLPRQLGLREARLGNPDVVEAQLPGEVRLLVAGKNGARGGNARPVRLPGVERDEAGHALAHPAARYCRVAEQLVDLPQERR